MATGGVGSDTMYTGTVEYVIKNYGFISLHNGNPVPKAFFDRASVGGALTDLTERFKKGSQIRARIARTDGEHKVKYKAFSLMLANQRQDVSIRGGDHFLRKYIMDNGPIDLEDLVDELEVAQGCPRFLRDGDVDDVKRVVASRPDWFEIKNDTLCLCQIENEVTNSLLTRVQLDGGKLCSDAIDRLFCNNHKLVAYLGYAYPAAKGYKFKDFVSRHAMTFIYWDDHLWERDNLLRDPELCNKFHQDLKAVKYYAQFVVDSDCVITKSSLSGHWGQASNEIKKIVRPRPSEFNPFLDRNSFFFDFDCDGDIEECPQHRLDVITRYWLISRNAIQRTSPGVHSTPILSSEGDMLQRLLNKNGAIRCSKLMSVPEISGVSQERLTDVCQRSAGKFSIRNNFLCFKSLEDYLVMELFNHVEKGPVSMLDVKSIFPDGSEAKRYLLAPAKNPLNAVKQFLERNADWFLVFENNIHSYNDVLGPVASALGLKKKFQCEMKAISFYSRFIDDDGGTECVSLRGHYAQAPGNVRTASSACEDDFKAFLKRNYFFFDIKGEKVKLYHRDRLKVIDEYWLNKNMVKSTLDSRPPVSSYVAQASNVQTSPLLLPDQTSRSKRPPLPVFPASPTLAPLTLPSPASVRTPVQVSKAFSDADAEANVGKPRSTWDVPKLSSNVARLNLSSTTTAQPSLLQSQISSRREPSKGADTEAQIFKKLVGNEISCAIQEIESDLNCLLLLRLNIGKPPMAKFRIPGESGGYSHTLNVDQIKSEDLQRMLRYEEVMKMDAPSHYGIKGTLHGIRTMGQTGKLSGLTLFCQLHEPSDGLGLDIWGGKKLTAVFNGNYPVKHIYNYLRCKSEMLSRRGDVLVIDVDGQLSGCDDHPHPSLGNVTRMLCPSSSELSQVIMDTVQHMHEYVIIIGIDSKDQLKSIQKMCNKDTQVIAEVASDLKSEVERSFC